MNARKRERERGWNTLALFFARKIETRRSKAGAGAVARDSARGVRRTEGKMDRESWTYLIYLPDNAA